MQAMLRPRLSGILARALLGTVAALSTGAATGGLLELVGKREDLTPWRDMPAATVDAWLRVEGRTVDLILRSMGAS